MAHYPLSTAQLDALRDRTDPAAETVVNKLFAHYGLERANFLFRHISQYEYQGQIPEFMRDFLEDPGALPDWVDPEKIQQGREVFQNYGREVILALLCRSLPMCYICENGAHVLTTTARLIDIPKNPNYARRLLETFQFVINVCEGDLLEWGGKSVISIRKVRLIHATIRRYIRENMDWPAAEYGEPINQEDQLITLSAFSLEVVKALDKMGIRLSEQEREGWLQLWRLTGYLLGIEERLLPQNFKACEEMSEKILSSQARKSEGGQLLCHSCMEFMSRLLPISLLRPFSYSVFKYMNDEAYRGMMGFDRKHWLWDRVMPRLMKSTLGVDQKWERRSPLLKAVIRFMNRLLINGLSKIVMKNEKYFYLPASLKA
jgi:hypothetical protein